MAAQSAQPESTGLVVFEKLTPAAVFAPGGVNDILEKIAREVRHTPVDISSKSGREHCASLAYKVARSKTALDKMGKELGETHYKSWKAITAERSRIETELDALRDEVRKPLTDWENAEKLRIDNHEQAIVSIEGMRIFDVSPTAADIKYRLDAFESLQPRVWEEFSVRASFAETETSVALRRLLDETLKREADAAELAQLRAEQVIREQKEREDRIAAEAAELARIAAEHKAECEAREIARKVEVERLLAEQEKAAATARAEQAESARSAAAAKSEQNRIDDHERALRSVVGMINDACSPFNGSDLIQHISGMIDSMSEMGRDWEEFADRFSETLAAGKQKIADRLSEVRRNEEQRAKEAAEKAARERKEAAESEERRQLAAIEAERQRVADLAAADAAETAKRNANTAHKSKINTSVLAALVALGLDASLGKAVITAIVKGAIPHTKISY
jgi:colicin import membrane protein